MSGILASTLAVVSFTTPEAAVYDALERTIGPTARRLFDLSLALPETAECSGRHCFHLQTTPGTPGTPAPTVSVSGSTASELAYGAAFYLRHRCNMSFAWDRAGGRQVRAPAAWPLLDEPVVVARIKPFSYYQNVVTESYSMWSWDWARWERELDWMALSGVNLALAYVGQEQVYKQVYNALGVNDSVILGTFDGPAFLAWSRGQGSAGTAGPLPHAWLNSQLKLNQNITKRMRELGIAPILSAFQA